MTTTFNEDVAAVLQELRLEACFSVSELSRLSGVPRTTLSRSLAGQRSLPAEDVFNLCQVLRARVVRANVPGVMMLAEQRSWAREAEPAEAGDRLDQVGTES